MPVKFRRALIQPHWEDSLFSMMGDTLIELGHIPIIINGVEDHVHALWRHHKTQSFSHTLKILKGRSSRFINQQGFTESTFRWQGGYGAFSVSTDRVEAVRRYISRQKEHHARTTVFEEYENLLKQQGEREIEDLLFSPLQ